MTECDNCSWVGQWETYEDAGYDGHLCDVCAWTRLYRQRDMTTGEFHLARSLALVANVLCDKLGIKFDLAVKANQLLLEDN